MTSPFPDEILHNLWQEDRYFECFESFSSQAEQLHGVSFIFDPKTLPDSFKCWRDEADNPSQETIESVRQIFLEARDQGPQFAERIARVLSMRRNLRTLSRCLIEHRVVYNIKISPHSNSALIGASDIQDIRNEFFALIFCCAIFWYYIVLFFPASLDDVLSSKFLKPADLPHLLQLCRNIKSGLLQVEDVFDSLIYKP